MSEHTTVLLQESVSGLTLTEGDRAIDATLGLGGHSEALLRAVGEHGRVLGIDADQNALDAAKSRLGRNTAMHFALGNFRDIDTLALAAGIETANGILFDLGWNATQLESGRGFSFRSDDPLIMTLAAHPAPDASTAGTIVNEWPESDLAEIISTLGEERFAKRIARAIVEKRRAGPILTARALAEVIQDSVPAFYRRGKIHPATKTFQALRMMVNDELSSLQTALQKSFEILAPKGRISVITFHSLEDRLVKRFFRSLKEEGKALLVTKKPLTPEREELIQNPRARSAKLRIIQKL